MKSIFSLVRKRISYANIAATLAVLFAMTSGALAASKYIITSTKQIKPSVLAQIKGKNGAAGAQGAQGPAGPAGAQGGKGENGANGSNGSNGSDGKVGAAGPKGTTGASGVPGASGVTGPTGQTGFTKVLPSGATETGVWSVNQGGLPIEQLIWVPISFPIPLPGESANAFYFNQSQTAAEEFGTSGCTGTLPEPSAPPGTLCMYTGAELIENVEVRKLTNATGSVGYGVSGAVLKIKTIETPGKVELSGTWAVTAP